MIFIISYDITKNSTRSKIAKLLIKKGAARLQYSVFAIQKDWREIEALKKLLQKTLQANNPTFATDQLMVIHIHKTAFDNMWTAGLFFEPKLISANKNDLVFL